MKDIIRKSNWGTVVIGAGQAGLAVGYYLKNLKEDFIILDEKPRLGDTWRNRWDSLLLFTPAQYDALPGMPFPAIRGSFPNKDMMANYLEDYAMLFAQPVLTGVKVKRLSSVGHHFELDSSHGKLVAERVIVATGTNPVPYVPSFASELSPEIFQLHSSFYRNPRSIPERDTLVVGAATSGIEIALEIAPTRTTYISGKPTFHIPDAILKYAGDMYWWFASNVMTIKTPVGKKARRQILNGGGPLIRISADDLDKAGVVRFPRMAGVRGGLPLMEDGTSLTVSSVVWCTGYRPDYSWIDMDISDDTGWPVTYRGVSLKKTDLYFVGMPFQYGLTSGLIGGVGRDAAYVAGKIRLSI